MVGLRKLNHSLEAYDCAPGLVPIRSRAPQPGDCLFFTDERSLAAYLGKLEFHFYPREIGFPLDDKLAFSKHLIALGFDPVPFLEIEDLDARVNFPVVLKCRYSWRAGSKLPRGAVCESREAVQEALRRFEVRGLEQGDFFFARLLA